MANSSACMIEAKPPTESIVKIPRQLASGPEPGSLRKLVPGGVQFDLGPDGLLSGR